MGKTAEGRMMAQRKGKGSARHSRNGASAGNTKAPARGAHEYPRPQLVREHWVSLNGPWEFAIDAEGEHPSHSTVRFGKQTITVPFAPETPASGVHNTGFFNAVWYRRTFVAPSLEPDERLILHFGAVDYAATV